MAEEAKKAETKVEKAGRPPKKKKSRPTNCTQTNKRIRRKNWYYRDGKYFANKQAHKAYVVAQAAKAEKEKETKAAAAAAASQAPTQA